MLGLVLPKSSRTVISYAWIGAYQPESILAKCTTCFSVRIRSVCSQAAHGDLSGHMEDPKNLKSNVLAVNLHATEILNVVMTAVG